MIRLAVLIAAFSALAAFGQSPASQRAVLLISVDGMRPDYVSDADRYGLKIPQLRRLTEEGAHATVRGVLPTVTYSSHTTLVTGVAPAAHGIYSNRPFDPKPAPGEVWYWFTESIRVPTLWDAAAHAGYVTGSVSWPVTVGAASIRFNIPEYSRMRNAEDVMMVRALSTPGLLSGLEKTAGPYNMDVNQALPRDWSRTRYAAEMIRTRGTRFITVHLAAMDHTQHNTGPFSPEALAAIEEIDKMVGTLREAIESLDPGAVTCIVSDHGFARVDHLLQIDAAFVKAGLITLQKSVISDWTAMPWLSGGSAEIILKHPKDKAAREKVWNVLHALAADANNGIAEVLDRPAIAELGGADEADFWVTLRSGFAMSTSLDGPIAVAVKTRGTHGYSPLNPDVNSTFILAGRGIRKGVDLGLIDMRSIAPTLARIMGLSFGTPERPALEIEAL